MPQHVGIANNRNFIDLLYKYYMLKDELDKKHGEMSENEILLNKRNMAISYLNLVNLCLSKVDIDSHEDYENNNEIRADYIDWLYWNRLIITHTINEYLEDHELTGNIKNFSDFCQTTQDSIRNFSLNNLSLNTTEKTIIIEYERVYRLACSRENKKVLWEQSARFFINYTQILINKRMLSTFGRDNIDKNIFQQEFNHLSLKIRATSDRELFNNLTGVYRAYKQFVLGDKNSRKAQDESLENALQLAHACASENKLQGTYRLIKESIESINERLNRGLEQAMKFTRVLFNPIAHPIKTLSNILYCIMHPVHSIQGVLQWAINNPWKAGILMLGGLTLGLITGLGTTVLLTLAMPIEIGIAIGAGLAVATLTSGVPAVQAAGNSGLLVASAKKDISSAKMKDQKLRQSSTEDANRIASQVKKEELIRKRLYQAYKQAEEEARILEQIDIELRAQRQREIEVAPLDDLIQAQSSYSEMLVQLASQCAKSKDEINQMKKNFSKTQKVNYEIRKGRKAAELLSHIHSESSSHRSFIHRNQPQSTNNNLLNLREISQYCQQQEITGFKIINPDGNCFFRSILSALGRNEEEHLKLRRQAIRYIQQNRDDFNIENDDDALDEYLANMVQNGTWAEAHNSSRRSSLKY